MVASSDLQKVITGEAVKGAGTVSAPLCPGCESRVVAQYGDVCHACKPKD
jgi:hypothetical protein